MVSPKRSHSPENDEQPEPKRAKLEGSGEPSDAGSGGSPDASSTAPNRTADGVDGDAVTAFVSTAPTMHSQARLSTQRSIALVLQHDGFDGATPEALEGFTQMVETCTSTRSIPGYRQVTDF